MRQDTSDVCFGGLYQFWRVSHSNDGSHFTVTNTGHHLPNLAGTTGLIGGDEVRGCWQGDDLNSLLLWWNDPGSWNWRCQKRLQSGMGCSHWNSIIYWRSYTFWVGSGLGWQSMLNFDKRLSQSSIYIILISVEFNFRAGQESRYSHLKHKKQMLQYWLVTTCIKRILVGMDKKLLITLGLFFLICIQNCWMMIEKL